MESPTLKARNLQKRSTDAEIALWNLLRNRRLTDYRFRRQVPVGKYIVDFLCFERKLLVELDGGQHQEQIEYDIECTRVLESRGYRLLRF